MPPDARFELVTVLGTGDGTTVQRFLAQLARLHATVPLASFEVKWKPAPDDFYLYEFTAQDGREWKQKIRLVIDRAEMTFQVSDFWRASEFTVNRDVLDTVIMMIKDYQLTKLEWGPS